MVALSGILCVTLAALHVARPAICAAATWLPAWLWLIPGGALLALGWRRDTHRWALACAAGWLVFLFLAADAPESLLRRPALSDADFDAARSAGRGLRVVSLNCAYVMPAAARETVALRPDIVLLQESGTRRAVEDIGRELYGGDAVVIWDFDTSVLARGSLVEREAISRMGQGAFTRALIRLDSGRRVEVVSLRLPPPIVRADLWNGECWTEHRDDRIRRRDLLRAFRARIEGRNAHVPLIACGDFNVPAGDLALRELRPVLADAFSVAGVGWGHSALNDLPVLRVDQVWVGRGVSPVAVRAHKTQNSDHRMVVCDLLLPGK
jgi:hypothetical protein